MSAVGRAALGWTGVGRWVAGVLSHLLSLVLLAGSALVLAWPGLLASAAGIAQRELVAFGFTTADVRIDRIGLHGAAGAVTLAPDAHVGAVVVTYRPATLLQGRIDRISLGAVRLPLAVAEDGSVRLAGVPLPGGARRGAAAPAGPGAVPVRRIDVRDADLTVSTPFGAIGAELSATGDVDPEAGLTVDGWLRLHHGGSRGTLTVSATLSPSAHLQATATLDEALWRIGPAHNQPVTGRLTLSASTADGLSTEAAVTVGTLGTLSASARLDRLTPQATLRVEAKADLTAADRLPWLDATGLGGGPASIDIDATVRDLESPESLTAEATLAVLLQDGRLAGRIARLDLAGRGRLTLAGGRLAFHPDGCVDTAVLPDPALGITAAEPLTACLAAPPNQALVDLVLAGAEAGAGRLAATADAVPFHLRRPGGAEGPIRGVAERLGVTVALTPGFGLGPLDVTLRSAPLGLPAVSLSATGADATIRVRPGSDPPVGLDASITTLRHTVELPAFAPLNGSVALRQAAEGWRGTLTLTGRTVPVQIDGSIRTNTSGAGRLDYTVQPVVLGDQGPDSATLSPASAPYFNAVAGTLSASGSVRWGRRGVRLPAIVTLDDITLATQYLTTIGLETRLTFANLWPPEMPEPQTVRMRRLLAAAPLENGRLSFALPTPQRLELYGGSWQLAGGRVALEPVHFALPVRDGAFSIRFFRVDLGTLIDLAGVEGLTGTGTLRGRVPIRLRDGAVSLEGGRVTTTGPGVLRYRPDSDQELLASGASGYTDLVRRMLQNFQYETLELSVTGPLGGEMSAPATLNGRNPDVQDGHTTNLEVSLSGELGTILNENLRLYHMPMEILRRSEWFQRQRRGG